MSKLDILSRLFNTISLKIKWLIDSDHLAFKTPGCLPTYKLGSLGIKCVYEVFKDTQN